VKTLAWVSAAIIVSLNLKLVIGLITEWVASAGALRGLILGLVIPLALCLLFLLLWVSFAPFLPAVFRRGAPVAPYPADVAKDLGAPVYKKILVSLDHTPRDRVAISHAAAMARTHGAKLYLLHVEEGVTSQVYGSLASTAEVEAGQQYLDGIINSLAAEGIQAEAVVRFSEKPPAEIVKAVREIAPDLLIMAAHGHKGLKDLVFGATINVVRHELEVPLLVVRDSDRKRV
jgi:manganese transport protein